MDLCSIESCHNVVHPILNVSLGFSHFSTAQISLANNAWEDLLKWRYFHVSEQIRIWVLRAAGKEYPNDNFHYSILCSCRKAFQLSICMLFLFAGVLASLLPLIIALPLALFLPHTDIFEVRRWLFNQNPST